MASIDTKVYTKVNSVAQPDCTEVTHQPVDVDFPAVNFAVNDLIRLAEVPAGVVLQDYELHFPAIGGAVQFSFGVLNAGATDLATVYATGLTAGQTSAIVRAANCDSAQDATYNTTSRKLALKVTTAPTGYTGNGKQGQVILKMRSK